MTTTDQTTSNIANFPSTRWSSVMESYRARRSARALQHRVERELSTYTSPSDLHELDAMLERSGEDLDSAYTQMIERVLMRAA